MKHELAFFSVLVVAFIAIGTLAIHIGRGVQKQIDYVETLVKYNKEQNENILIQQNNLNKRISIIEEKLDRMPELYNTLIGELPVGE